MGFSIRVDWMSELRDNYEKWENVGRQMIEEHCEHKTQDKDETNMRYSGWCEECGFSEDSAMPMMNFVYPLDIEPDDDKVLEVVQKTNCTVMYNTESDEYFLVLTGGGMDLSQDIALAYTIIQKRIPFDLAVSVCTQKELTVHGKDWKRLKEAMIENLKWHRDDANRYLEQWEVEEK